ncbi:MAG TPA: LuxR C-terminal-related transcriptional regulator, partial [Isosphaeraceae bacterium]|nr:LuxR C-terminal-related transcriptional regulator [Isosphaeraceae bacterium]
EAVRLLSSATQAHPLAGYAAQHDLLGDPDQPSALRRDQTPAPAISNDAWDAALVQTALTELLGGSNGPVVTSVPTPGPQIATADADRATISSGLSQLNKYLNRAWYRAGIPSQAHDDSSQAVYTSLLQNMGRQRFDALLADVGQSGIKDVLSRETAEGLSFFRAVDMVKKRAQRERVHQSLDSVDVPSSGRDRRTAAWRDALREAIDRTLSPREAALIQDTLMGKTPAEIALSWGVAPKTVSNEKSRVFQKLRDVLAAHEMN